MTKAISPAANAGLPVIDRRALVCGLGAAAVAGVPALASTAHDDPVFKAMAALEQLKIHAEEPDAALSIAEHAVQRAKKENVVILDDEEMRTHAQIDTHFKPAFGPEYDFDAFIERIEGLRPRPLPDAERAERDLARQAAHDELAKQEAAIAEVEQRTKYREIEAQQKSANHAVWDAEDDLMEAKPETPAGAVALLRFVAELMEILPDDEHYVVAIRNAADFFEGKASA
jgi:hypothetical protein